MVRSGQSCKDLELNLRALYIVVFTMRSNIAVAAVLLALAGYIFVEANRLPFGNIASPVDVQGKIFDNVQRNIR